MFTIHSDTHVVTITELRLRGLDPVLSKLLLDKLIKVLRCKYRQYKVEYPVNKFGKETTEIQWVRGVSFEDAYTRFINYYNKSVHKHVWKEAIAALNIMQDDILNKRYEEIKNEKATVVGYSIRLSS